MNKKLNIGFDIDGVLVDCEIYMKQKGSAYLNKPVLNPHGNNIGEIFGVSLQDENAFWRDHLVDYATTLPARENISAVIKKLRQMGHHIFIITNRGRDLSFCDMTQAHMQELVKAWLKKEQIEYDELYFANGDKVGLCRAHKINVFVEDDAVIIRQLHADSCATARAASPLYLLCFNASYNQGVSGPHIKRVFRAQDIYEFCLAHTI